MLKIGWYSPGGDHDFQWFTSRIIGVLDDKSYDLVGSILKMLTYITKQNKTKQNKNLMEKSDLWKLNTKRRTIT